MPNGYDPYSVNGNPSAFGLSRAYEGPFDASRFGGPMATAQPAFAFDEGRFGPAATGPTPAAGPYQDLNPGIKQDYEAARATLGMGPVPSQPAMAYAGAPAAPTAPAQAAIAGQMTTGAAQPAVSVNSQGFMGTKNPALGDMSPGTKGLLGGIGGALLGGALLGPIGAAVGGFMGRSHYGNAMNQFPSAPDPFKGQSDPGYGYDSLSDYGRDAYSNSSDFAGAVDSGSAGLW